MQCFCTENYNPTDVAAPIFLGTRVSRNRLRYRLYRRLTMAAITASLLPFLGAYCDRTAPVPMEKTAQDTAFLSFATPSDSLLSAAQIRSWLACNRPLDSLSELFTGMITASGNLPDDDALRHFSQTQDTICARYGLTGGLAEYRWVTEHLGSRANRRLFDSLVRNVKTP